MPEPSASRSLLDPKNDSVLFRVLSEGPTLLVGLIKRRAPRRGPRGRVRRASRYRRLVAPPIRAVTRRAA